MNRTNRIGQYQTDGSGGYLQSALPSSYKLLNYYIQNIDAADTHKNVQSNVEDSGNYTLYSTIMVDTNSSFSIEEFINIEGFVTPTPAEGQDSTLFLPYYNDSRDAFALSQSINYTAIREPEKYGNG